MMSDREISIDVIREAASDAIAEFLRRYGIGTTGHALIACDKEAKEIAGQLKELEHSGNLFEVRPTIDK